MKDPKLDFGLSYQELQKALALLRFMHNKSQNRQIKAAMTQIQKAMALES